MNKFFAEIIAGIIPHKPTRNRWRGILRYGIINAVRLLKQLRDYRQYPCCYLAICTIAKNEGRYFKEWIDWHHRHGVEKFYIYDNESNDNTKEVLKPYIDAGIVEYTWFPGYRRQLAAYDDCLERHRFEAHWIAFIDMDEFIVPLKEPSITLFLKKFEGFAAVEINWLIYGSSGKIMNEDGNVMERFKRHARPDHFLNRQVKSIVNPRKVFNMIGCHEASRISGNTADSHMSPVRKHFRDREPQLDIIRINHYAVRSYEEFAEKLTRGRASGTQRTIDLSYFKMYDLNDIEDA